jgi:hypothetical protein
VLRLRALWATARRDEAADKDFGNRLSRMAE